MDNPGLIEWGAAAMVQPGQVACGDWSVVAPFPGGVLVAVVDGLGHGEPAAKAAELAVQTLQAHASEAVNPLVQRCHAALARTRGAVLTLASFNALDNTMTWIGVGNVEGVLLPTAPNSRPEFLLLRGGVAGYQLPPLRAFVLPVTRGDTLILATDGIRSGFQENLELTGAPQEIADGILNRWRRGTDDALVLVARYVGGGR